MSCLLSPDVFMNVTECVYGYVYNVLCNANLMQILFYCVNENHERMNYERKRPCVCFDCHFISKESEVLLLAPCLIASMCIMSLY